MGRDWAAVAAAIQARLDELDMTQADLASRAGVAPETVRELRTNLRPRRRSPRTLTAVSEALGWPPDHLTTVLSGRQPEAANRDAAGELRAITQELTTIAGRLTDIAGRLSKLGR
jgi:transcriptional regulator with XRE-family HTH domain